MRKVLITGGAGYIGSVLTGRLLKNGYQVQVLDNLMYNQTSLLQYTSDPNFQFHYGDVRHTDKLKVLLKDADIIIPLAALVGMPVCDKNPLEAWSINRDAVIAINDMRSKDQIVLFPNSNSGYGTTTGEVYCDEQSPLNPISIYGRSKVEAERALLERGNVVTLRLATVFGFSPRMRLDLLVNDFTYRAIRDGYIVIYEHHFKRNYVHISDVADCFIHSIDNFDRMKDEPYNVGLNEANISKGELAALIQRYEPDFYYHFSKIGTDPDQRNYVVSNAKLNATGFTAKIGLEDGIQELLKAYRILRYTEHFHVNY